CVATDVAARGIDLPTLSLVVHVEIPRDAETLQHRSGRTGRAGKKGTAALIVPYSRRRRVESMLRGARIEAEWMDAPSPEQIRERDRERVLERMLAPVDYDEEDRQLAATVMQKMSAEDIAASLVRAHRAAMPQPEELTANTPDGRTREKAERHRPGFEDTVWFRIAVGRRQRAEPRWLLPLICRRGQITRNEIGAIRVGQQETHFQIPRAIADKFTDAVRTTANGDDEQDSIVIEAASEPPRETARANRREHRPGNVQPRPFRDKGSSGERATGGKFEKRKFSGKPKPYKSKGPGKSQGKGKPRG
ncbi:DbpA RNA binding domain-containing protein, partial [Qipengyuania sp.]|uniref:DbpA RNA binding domain-containing protein n=1 Tax=Qipengyuania sp. TaxID=2004515 RepID=UPI0035C7ED34